MCVIFHQRPTLGSLKYAQAPLWINNSVSTYHHPWWKTSPGWGSSVANSAPTPTCCSTRSQQVLLPFPESRSVKRETSSRPHWLGQTSRHQSPRPPRSRLPIPRTFHWTTHDPAPCSVGVVWSRSDESRGAESRERGRFFIRFLFLFWSLLIREFSADFESEVSHANENTKLNGMRNLLGINSQSQSCSPDIRRSFPSFPIRARCWMSSLWNDFPF